MDYLVGKGLPFRDAHEVVGALMWRLIDEKRLSDHLSLAEWQQHSPLFGEDVKQAVTSLASILKKQTSQSTSSAALSETMEWLKSSG